MKRQFFEHLSNLARSDKRIFLLVGDIGYGAVEGFASEFPDRFLNVGVAEQNMATIAAGLAKKGFRPFIYSIANFPLLRAFEQVRNDIVHERLPVTIVSIGTGFDYGNLGYSHHAIEDVGAAFSLQGLEIYAPASHSELEATLFRTIGNSLPTYIKLTKKDVPIDLSEQDSYDLEPYVFAGPKRAEIGLVAYGSVGLRLVEIAKIIKEKASRNSKLISMPNLRFSKTEAFDGLSYIFLIEEQTQNSGAASNFAFSLSASFDANRIYHIALEDTHRQTNGNESQILEAHDFSSVQIAERVLLKLSR